MSMAATIPTKMMWRAWLVAFAALGWALGIGLLALILFGGPAQRGLWGQAKIGAQPMDPVTARTYERVLRQKGIAPANITVQSLKDDSSALQGPHQWKGPEWPQFTVVRAAD
jgi:hypothetical protein